ncbi:hypothetical protein JCM10213v2_006972 [Rhodosporidiobolus nylandii]
MQLLVVSLLGGSLLFVFVSAIIIFGVGSSFSGAPCSVGIWLCILLYAATKAVLYVLLLEKLHVVHCHTAMGRVPRLKSWYYRGGLCLFVAWIAVTGAMIAGRIALIRQHDGACIIGMRLWSTVPMLGVDAITNIYLTTLFIIPIWRSSFPKAQRLARVSAIAAVAALLTSFANILVLTLEHGHQLSWVCLGSCGLDVCFNSAIVYFVTSAGRQKDELMTTQERDPSKVGRTSRNASHFLTSSSAHPFSPTSTGVGVTVVEEIRVDEDTDLQPFSTSTRSRPRPVIAPPTTVSFKEPLGDLDLKADEKTPESEKELQLSDRV